MKSMNDDTNNNNNNNNNNWLGFSLSPHMKMEVNTDPNHQYHHHHHHHQAPPSPAVPTSFYLSSSSSLNSSGICYGVGENGAFHSPLSVMPLKSDGSLCIMEALTRSQPEGMVSSSSPKLEDFLGGATMETHHHQYGSHDRETMALSLDSMYYHHHQNTESESNRQQQHSLDFLQQQQQQFQVQTHHPYYLGMPCHAMYQTPLDQQQHQEEETKLTDCDSQIPQNWVTRHHHHHYSTSNNNAFEQQQMSSNTMVDDGGASSSVGCGDLQSLSLSMSPGSQSSCVTAPLTGTTTTTDCVVTETKKRGPGKVAGGAKQPVHRKSIDTFGQRTSQYRGVTRHRWTGRYEAHLWDNSCKKEGQTRKGRQVYLGGYDMEEKAARAYDLAALKYWGPSTHINFPLENYRDELEEMKNMSRQEYVAHLRRKSSGFSRGASMYRGVTRHHQHGRWQARIGRVAGNKDLYLGTFSTQEEAAEAYDVAAIKFRGVNAVTNFDITRYDVERIMASNTLLAGEFAKRSKEVAAESSTDAIGFNTQTQQQQQQQHNGETIQPESDNNGNASDWKMTLYQNPQQQANASIGSLDRNSSISLALQDLMGIDSSQANVDESAKLGGGIHFSNASSLVTSLSSSREASPDKGGAPMLFARPPLASKFISPATGGVSSWFPSTAISMSHLPVFAAWNDT